MATGVAVLALATGASQQRKAAKSQRRAQKVQVRRADIENARQRRQQVVTARRQRASAIAQAEASGISGGSQIAGAAGSVQTQSASNISFLNQLESLDRTRFSALSDANTFQGRAGLAGSIAGVASGPLGSELESFFRPG